MGEKDQREMKEQMLISNILKSPKEKKNTKEEPQRVPTHILPPTHRKRKKPPNRGRLHGHSLSIKWKPVSHFIITLPPQKAGLLHNVSSFTAMLKHTTVKTNPQQDLRMRRKIGKYPHEIWPQLENSTTLALQIVCFSGKCINQ